MYPVGTDHDLCGLSGEEGGGDSRGPQTPQEPPTAVYSPDTAGQSEREREIQSCVKSLIFYDIIICL